MDCGIQNHSLLGSLFEIVRFETPVELGMTRHSKNNTAGSCFTYAERQMLDYGTKRQRLGKDSKLEFGACNLCLQFARDPMICDQGHIYCKECIYENILNQKKELTKQKKKQATLEIEKDQKKRLDEDEQKLAAIKQFERDQDTFLSLSIMKKVEKEAADGVAGVSPAADKPAHFWNPQSSSSIEDEKKAIKKEVLCIYGHPIGLKTLHPVIFEENGQERVCPLCKETLSNNMTLQKFKCGHVVCEACFKEIPVESKASAVRRCCVCSEEGPIILIANEGTSYSGKGKVLASKYEIAFH